MSAYFALSVRNRSTSTMKSSLHSASRKPCESGEHAVVETHAKRRFQRIGLLRFDLPWDVARLRLRDEAVPHGESRAADAFGQGVQLGSPRERAFARGKPPTM